MLEGFFVFKFISHQGQNQIMSFLFMVLLGAFTSK
jgi:hypothetical protein